MKEIIFRCNVSPEIGTGHIRRCLVLADEIQKLNGRAFFILKSKHIDLSKLLLPIVKDWVVLDWEITPEDELQRLVEIFNRRKGWALVVDHYEADPAYQQYLFSSGVNWLQFDGCSGQPLWADWVLNPSLASSSCEYDMLLKKEGMELLLGPDYAFLRSEFRDYRKKTGFRNEIKKFLVTMGGGDDRGGIVFCLNALKMLGTRYECIVLSTSQNPNNLDISRWINENQSDVQFVVDEKNIAKRMCEADIAITAGGMTTFETAAMGLPSLIIQIAENQARNAAAWDNAGVALDMGRLERLSSNTLCKYISQLIEEPSKRKQMHERGMRFVDCCGALRVAELVLRSRGEKKNAENH